MEKRPFLTEEQAQEIIQDVPTPFHVYDEKASVRTPAASTRPSAGTRLPGVFCRQGAAQPHHPADPEGRGLRCGLLLPDRADAERGLRFTGSDIMFSSNQTPVEDMKKAYELAHTSTWTMPPWWTSWTVWPGSPRTSSAATTRAGPSSWARARRLPGHGQARRCQVRHDRGADDRQLQEADGKGRKELWHPCLPGLQHHLRCLLP